MFKEQGGESPWFQAELDHFSPSNQELLMSGGIDTEIVTLHVMTLGVKMVEDNIISVDCGPLVNPEEHCLVRLGQLSGCVMTVIG